MQLSEYQKDFIISAYSRYESFRDTDVYNEYYKWEELEHLNEELQDVSINAETISDIVDCLKEGNPNQGSFVYWGSLDDLANVAEENPELMAEAVKKLLDEDQALEERIREVKETLVARLLPEPAVRSRCLEVFSSSVLEVHSYGREKWGTYCTDDRVRLVMGSLIVCTIHEGGVWLTLDKEKVEKLRPQLEESSEWEWDTGEHGEYSAVPSVNGYYMPEENLDLWGDIKDAHFSFFEKVADKYEKLPEDSQKKHDPEVLNYLREELDRDIPSPKYGNNCWLVAPGREARLWDEMYEEGFIGLGWDKIGDFTQYDDQEEFERAIAEAYDSTSVPTNNAKACYEFIYEMEPGDRLIAKQGGSTLLGYGEVLSDYRYLESRDEHKHVRDVCWTQKGEWTMPEGSQLPLKTLTPCSEKQANEYLEIIKSGSDGGSANYFWITANPKIWKVEKLKTDQSIFYTAYNKKGNKRRIFSSFQKAKPGDKTLFYEATPTKRVLMIGEVTRGLHPEQPADRDKPVEGITVKYMEDLAPIGWSQVTDVEELEDSAPVRNQAQGSLFELSEKEYETILALELDQDGAGAVVWGEMEADHAYDFEGHFEIKELHFPPDQKAELENNISNSLRIGKHIILTGPPGTGKSKLAKEICRFYTGDGDGFCMNTATSDWSTFDTIGGYRPEDDGTLSFRSGLFLKCFKDQKSFRTRNRWMIIDEINRADIDKAFGSLFSALTGDNITIPFEVAADTIEVVGAPWSEMEVENSRFVIHPDWRIIATMNTFDKASLYEMSYAFMRRFAFIPVGIPETIDAELIRGYLEVWHEDPAETWHKGRSADEILPGLWQTINDTRKIGPAVVRDIYDFVGQNGDLIDALILFVLPQFEGLLDEKIIGFIRDVDLPNQKGRLRNFCADFFGINEDRFKEAE
ncbi:MAG: EVE domain-containing protein [Planctomycetes bacterium]|nr:EVE domain-containing protein [Planctomycetota bacterium]